MTDEQKHTLNLLALSLSRRGKFKSALDVFDYMSALYPECTNTLNAYAIALFKCGKIAQANDVIMRACRLDTANPDLYNNAGVLLKALRKLDDAIKYFDIAISLKTDHANAHYNKANSLRCIDRLEAALVCFDQAIYYQPNFANAYYNRAKTLFRLKRYAKAAKDFTVTLKLRPGDWESHYGLGNTFFEMGALEKAISHLNIAAKSKPDNALIHLLLGDCWRELSQEETAKQKYQDAISAKFHDLNHVGSLLFSLHYLSDPCLYKSIDKADLVSRAQLDKPAAPLSSNSFRQRPEKLRIGFLSPDLNKHPVGYFLEHFTSCLTKTKFEWIAFPVRQKSDSLTARLKPNFCEWLSINSHDDKEAANFIYDQKIDILIDLSGHTAHNRLGIFNWRPAAIQASWLGYFATTGLKHMDYIIGDPFVTPLDEQSDFTETIIQMPKSFLCFSTPKPNCLVNKLPAKKNGFVTFGCFNHSYKLNLQVISVWVRILKQMPKSRLFLKSKKFDFPDTRSRIIDIFASQGICPSRLTIEGASPRNILLASYNRVDIALDPFPFPGVTTSVESLWMGVPVLTRTGSHFLSHVGEMIANNIGLTDWIATDNYEYVEKAVAFASDLEALAQIRLNLRSNMQKSALCNAPNFASNFEQLMNEMWEKTNSPSFG